MNQLMDTNCNRNCRINPARILKDPPGEVGGGRAILEAILQDRTARESWKDPTRAAVREGEMKRMNSANATVPPRS